MNVMSPKENVLIAWSNMNPAYMMKGVPGAVLPNLKQWSDVTYLSWLAALNEIQMEMKPPMYILRVLISNEQTLDIVDQIVRNSKTPPLRGGSNPSVPRWPGLTLTPENEGFRALLASPNASGVCWILIEHKSQFGVRQIDQATIFTADNGYPALLFRVGPALRVNG